MMIIRLVAVLLLWAFAATPAIAQVGTAAPGTEVDVQLRAGVNWTDNLGRETDGESETFGSVGTTLGLSREASRLRASLDGHLDYFHYDSERFDNELVGRIDGLLGFALIPQRLDWMFENSFVQVRTDPFAPEGPGNREYLNVFETGPDLYLPIDARTMLSAAGRYADRRWQDSDQLDSEVVSGNLGVMRALRPTQQVGLTIDARRIAFDSDLVSTYKVYSAYGSYQRELATGEVGLELGATRLDIDGRSDTGALVRVNWTRDLTVRSSLRLAAGREYQDAGDQLLVGAPVETGFGPTGDTGLVGDPYVYTFASATYTLDRDRAVFTFGGGWNRQRYDTSILLDRDAVFGDAGVTYRFTPLLSGDLRLSLRREDFDRIDGGTADDFTALASLSRRIGRELDVLLAYQYSERDSDFGFGYEENRISLNLVWTPGRR